MFVKEVQQVTEVQDVLTKLVCDSCEATIPFVFPDLRCEQGVEMLTIVFEGGYGEYIDRINGTPKMHLCQRCADDLRHNNPAIARCLEGHASPLKGRPVV